MAILAGPRGDMNWMASHGVKDCRDHHARRNRVGCMLGLPVGWRFWLAFLLEGMLR